jgi:hypothetical protein
VYFLTFWECGEERLTQGNSSLGHDSPTVCELFAYSRMILQMYM